MWWRSLRFTGTAFAIFAIFSGSSPSALGKDLNVLITILYAAFIAEDTSGVCSASGLGFSQEDNIAFNHAKAYAALIKQKVISGLNSTDVDLVLRSAADRAKNETREAIQVLRSYGREHEPLETLRWCTTSVNRIAIQVVSAYADQPAVIEALIEKAKIE